MALKREKCDPKGITIVNFPVLSKIFDDVVARDFAVRPPQLKILASPMPQSKILASPMPWNSAAGSSAWSVIRVSWTSLLATLLPP